MSGIKMNKVDMILRTVLVLGVISTISIPLQAFNQTVTCRVPATIIGTPGDDVIVGTNGNDVINGLAGNDIINGMEGNDIICGDAGNDVLYGHYGNDVIYGGDGIDIINAGPDNDSCLEGETNYSCESNTDGGLDPNQETDNSSPTILITSPTDGSIVSGIVTIESSATDNVGVTKVEFYADGALIGADGTNNYSLMWDSTNVIDGFHTLTAKAYDAAGNIGDSNVVGVTVDNTPPDPDPSPDSTDCQGIPATIVGTPGNDLIMGTTGPDVINGIGGDDRIFGRSGDDLICGGDGNDTIYAGYGNDVIYGGNGNDFLSGDIGNDLLYGEDGNDVLSGGIGDDTTDGGEGTNACLSTENKVNC